MVNLKETFLIIFLETQRRNFKLFYNIGFKCFYTLIFYWDYLILMFLLLINKD